jgi:hypothetical protein
LLQLRVIARESGRPSIHRNLPGHCLIHIDGSVVAGCPAFAGTTISSGELTTMRVSTSPTVRGYFIDYVEPMRLL